jgi:hypothetical protein
MCRWKALSLVLFTPVVCLIALGLIYLCPLGRPKPFRRAAFDRVIAEIRTSALRPDRQGGVALPRDFASLSATGRAYVRRWPSGRLVVFFPSWVGRGTLLISLADCSGDNWLQGYVYDTRPWSYKPPRGQVDKDDDPDVLAPPPEPFWKAARDGRSKSRLFSHREKITEHWCSADIFS